MTPLMLERYEGLDKQQAHFGSKSGS